MIRCTDSHQKFYWLMCQTCGIHEAVGHLETVTGADIVAKAKSLGWLFVPFMKCDNCQLYNL